MRKLILGIALVITLDLAFIFSVNIEKNMQEIAKAQRQVVVPKPPDPLAPLVAENEVPPSPEPDSVQTDRSVRTRPRPLQADAAEPNVKPLPQYAPYKPAEKFEDTIIYIARSEPLPLVRPEPVAEPPAPVEKQASIQPAQKKRSAWSRTYRVIKKPYDWVRSAIESL